MNTTSGPGSRRAVRHLLVAAVSSIALLGLTATAVGAQTAPTASVSTTCSDDEGGVVIVTIDGEDGDLFDIEVDGELVGTELAPGEYEFVGIDNGAYEVGIYVIIDPDTAEEVLVETVTVDCAAEATTTTTAPPSPSTTAAPSTTAPAPAAANSSAARGLSFTG